MFAGPFRADRLYVGGELVVEGGSLVRADEREIARAQRAQARDSRHERAPLSTHVLDTGAGRPARGRRRLAASRRNVIAELRTDADGRARLADELEPGAYRLVFHPPSPFFRRVELELELDEGHHHVPLLVSPYSCASYRGS